MDIIYVLNLAVTLIMIAVVLLSLFMILPLIVNGKQKDAFLIELDLLIICVLTIYYRIDGMNTVSFAIPNIIILIALCHIMYIQVKNINLLPGCEECCK